MFVKHDHGDPSYTHIHAELDDRIICKICGWEGRISECKVKFSGVLIIGEDIFFCPGQRKKRILFFFKKLVPCNTRLVYSGEEATILLLEGVRPAESLS